MAKPNILDRAVAAVAPVHAAKRAAARAALSVIDSGYGNYGANQTKKSMRGWMYHGGSAKEDIEDNLDVLRQRSRDAYMGIPTAAAALKTMRTNVVASGLIPSPQIDGEYLGLTQKQTEELQGQIIREFSIWADTPVCDAERVDNFYKLQQLAFTSPRTSKNSGKNSGRPAAPPGSCLGISRTVARLAVTSSPTTPSPRVEPRTRRPFRYSRLTERPSILASTM